MALINFNRAKNKPAEQPKSYTAEQVQQVFNKVVKRYGYPNTLGRLKPEQLYKYMSTVEEWRLAVEDAEDIYSQNLYDLAELYHTAVDDYSVASSMQQRTSKAINSKIMFLKPDSSEDEEAAKIFLNADGSQKGWFRRWLKVAQAVKYYGFQVAQLGKLVDGGFIGYDGWQSVEPIPYEHLLPMYRLIKKHPNGGIYGSNVISMDTGAFSQWLVPMGNKKDLGILSKAMPFVIWKDIFENWKQHAEIFGMPFREGRTEIRDVERMENMARMFEEMLSSSYAILHPDDEINFIENAKTDAFNIYKELINKCDEAIVKLFLSQTSTTDEKSFVGSANTHERVLGDVVLSDRLDLSELFTEQLVPKLKRLGVVPAGFNASLTWIVEEQVSLTEWADIIQKLSSIYKVDKADVEAKFNISLEDKPAPEPVDLEEQEQPEGFKDKLEKMQNLYTKLWHEQ